MYKGGAVYIMSSINKRVIYIGVTSDLRGRVWEHKDKKYPGSFTARFNCIHLVYYKRFDSIEEAIAEEKRLKGSSRKYKESLINEMNYSWQDLYDSLEY